MALATIVAVRGSTYRRPGARLLVPEDGAPIGNISGGCLEGDVADMARIVMEEGRARLAGWDLTADDDDVWGLGLGCNGAIEVFIEPAERAAEVAGALRMALEEERPISVVTVLESPREAVGPAPRIVVKPDGSSEGSLGDRRRRRRGRRRGEGAARLADVGDPHAARRRPGVRRGARAAAPIADLRRRPRRDPLGEGRGGPRLERRSSWTTARGSSRRERYPDAAGFVQVEEPEDAAKVAPTDERTFVVVMTHNFLRDKEYLRSFLASPVGLHRHARTGRSHPAAADGAGGGGRRRSPTRTARGSTAPPGSTWAARARRRSPGRSSRRSSPCADGRTADSSRSGRARSTIGRVRAPRPG